MSAATAALSIKTARPAASQGRVHAFLLASTGESFRDLQRHYTQVGTLYPTYFDCRAADGAITGRDDPLVTRWSQLRGILVLPRFNCQREDTLHRILTDATLRSATLTRLVELVRTHGYDGINIDFENGAAERPRRAHLVRVRPERTDARDRQAPVGRGVGKVRAHHDRAVRACTTTRPWDAWRTTCS